MLPEEFLKDDEHENQNEEKSETTRDENAAR
jgi:hypothetical protein